MAEKKSRNQNKRTSFFRKLRHRYLISVMHEDHFGERLNFRLSAWNLIVILFGVISLMVGLTIYLVAFTGLREYIPGYADVNQRRLARQLLKTTDSLEVVVQEQQQLLSLFQQIASGNNWTDPMPEIPDSALKVVNPINRKSREDSLLRIQIEEAEKFAIQPQIIRKNSLENMLFFPPIRGKVVRSFNREEQHFGTDIAASNDEAVLACLEGMVIFCGWTAESGHVIILQHTGNLISVYMHNAVLLKKAGQLVHSGEPIAIVGYSGDIQKTPMLHLQLWLNGSPTDPESLIQF